MPEQLIANNDMTERDQGRNFPDAPRGSKPNPQVFFDLIADGEPLGRLVFELRKDVAPVTVENFRQLCAHENGFGYTGCLFYRVIPGFCACSGDFETNNDCRDGGKSVYEEKYFKDENFQLKHTRDGILSMDNYGWPDTNSSRFFITFDACRWMDEYHVAFGRVIRGMDVLKKLETYGTIEGHGAQEGKTIEEILIEECGEIPEEELFSVDNEELWWGQH